MRVRGAVEIRLDGLNGGGDPGALAGGVHRAAVLRRHITVSSSAVRLFCRQPVQVRPSGAKPSHADLSRAHLDDANLIGANLSQLHCPAPTSTRPRQVGRTPRLLQAVPIFDHRGISGSEVSARDAEQRATTRVAHLWAATSPGSFPR
jgi:hypothetical protein